MIFKGFRFGMLLQLAVGPMCLFVFNTSAANGFWSGFSIVAAITIIDALYIILSGFGVSALLDKKNVKQIIKFFGAAVLVLFGLNTLLGAFDISLLPDIKLFSQTDSKSFFISGLLLTASNPLTIVFWSGVFSTQVIENNYNKTQLVLFGVGCVLSTLAFLTAVAALGTVVSGFLNEVVINVLNIIVGTVIIFFGVKLLVRRSDKKNA